MFCIGVTTKAEVNSGPLRTLVQRTVLIKSFYLQPRLKTRVSPLAYVNALAQIAKMLR